MVGQENKERAEEALADFGRSAVVSARSRSGHVASTRIHADGFLHESNTRIRHDGDK